jgi:hypothetical protein
MNFIDTTYHPGFSHVTSVHCRQNNVFHVLNIYTNYLTIYKVLTTYTGWMMVVGDEEGKRAKLADCLLILHEMFEFRVYPKLEHLVQYQHLFYLLLNVSGKSFIFVL